MKVFAPYALRSPELFPQAFEPRADTVTLLRLTRGDYTAASFLDDRILGAATHREHIAWAELAPAIDAAQLAEHCAFLFHIGHVGSTLLARLIGEHAGAFVLREPAILRTFAQLRQAAARGATTLRDAALNDRLAGTLKLLSRTFAPRERALIKATSFVSEMADELLSRPAAAPALMLSVAPATYLATILGGDNSRRENAALLPGRMQRLVRRTGIEARAFANLREGEAIALSWACETSALAQAAGRAGARILQIDFDRFLADPKSLLLAALTHLRIPAGPAEVEAIVAGPLMHRYSKAPEFAYDTALRQAVIGEARTRYGDEIRLGLSWLDRMAGESGVLREAFAFAGRSQRPA
jgi:hypothetical protein